MKPIALGQAASPVLFSASMRCGCRSLCERFSGVGRCLAHAPQRAAAKFFTAINGFSGLRHNSRATLNYLGFLRLYFPCTTKLTVYAGSARDVTRNPPVATRPSCDLPSVGRLCL